MSTQRDRIRVGFIGVGNRGTQLLERFLAEPDAEVVALCDVYEPYLQRDRSRVHPRYRDSGIPVPRMTETLGDGVARYRDFRDLLARDDIDAVCIATPDHWHAVQTILAFRAGKDVFVEKPLTATVHEGRRMVQVERETGRIGAVCLNRRGSSVYRRLAAEVREGLIGPVAMAYASRVSDMYPAGIGRCSPEPPPEDLDWDLWLGPRAERPYQYNIAPYMFRWWQDFSSQMGNWGVQYMDAIRWVAGETAPVAVSACGSRLIDDDRTIPDTMTSTFEFASGMIVRFDICEAAGGRGVQGGEVELRGSKGTLVASQDGFSLTPARAGQFQTWDALVEPRQEAIRGDRSYGDLGIREDTTAVLIRDFLDCVRTRRAPLCTLEEGHRSTCFAHMANIALAVGRRLRWDADRECFVDCDEANAMLHYNYRQPWRNALE